MSDTPPTDDTGVEPGDGIEPIEIQAEMEDSFLQYAMSVIIARKTSTPAQRGGGAVVMIG